MWEVEWQGSAENETLAARQLAEVPDSAPESPSNIVQQTVASETNHVCNVNGGRSRVKTPTVAVALWSLDADMSKP